jgi:hypothetical protein
MFFQFPVGDDSCCCTDDAARWRDTGCYFGMSDALTGKQAKFVAEFALDHNASRAARAAGYGVAGARVTACRLLANPNVSAAVAELEADAEKALGVTRDGVLKQLWTAFEMAKEQGEPASMIAACKAVAAICGYDRPQQHMVDLNVGAEDCRYEAMTDADLMKVAVGEGTAGA